MSLNEKISDLLEEELKLRMDLLLTEYAETISRKYQISLHLLLKDIPCVSVTSTCMGTKPDGSRCTFKGIHNGYCGSIKNKAKKLNRDFMRLSMVIPMVQVLEMLQGVQRVKDLFQLIGL